MGKVGEATIRNVGICEPEIASENINGFKRNTGL